MPIAVGDGRSVVGDGDVLSVTLSEGVGEGGVVRVDAISGSSRAIAVI